MRTRVTNKEPFIMGKQYAFGFIGFIVLFILITYGDGTPFIYTNRNLALLVIAYFLLVVWFFCHVVYGFMAEESSIKKLRENKSLAYITLFGLPLLSGWSLSFLLPIAVDIFSTNTVVREYKLVKIEQHRRYTAGMSEVFATDRARKQVSFVLKNFTLSKLNLQEGESFLVNGRDSSVGLVIDKINGVSHEAVYLGD